MKKSLFILSLLALLVSSYLTINHYSGRIPPCAESSGCETVLTSEYSVVLGIPVSAWGLFYDLGLLILILGLLATKDTRFWLRLYAFIGLAVSVGLMLLQANVIGSFCAYCTTHALLIISISLLSINGLNSKEKNGFN